MEWSNYSQMLLLWWYIALNNDLSQNSIDLKVSQGLGLVTNTSYSLLLVAPVSVLMSVGLLKIAL